MDDDALVLCSSLGSAADQARRHGVAALWALFFSHHGGGTGSPTGFNRHSNDVWSEALRPRVRVLAPRLEAWAKDHLLNVNKSKALAYMLTTPAASDILLRWLTWIHNAAKSGDRFWGWRGEKAGPDDAVLTRLVHAWTHARDSLRRDEAAFGAFRGLLEHLVSRQHSPALELADRVGAMLQ
jgi:hypothetical protein